eukprot:279220-Amphidinium_carterae.1
MVSSCTAGSRIFADSRHTLPENRSSHDAVTLQHVNVTRALPHRIRAQSGLRRSRATSLVAVDMADQSFPYWWPWWLNQNDFFTLSIGGIGTAYSVGAYNQSAYIGNVQMRQAQLYQKKNYHLSWVAIARDDCRA